MLVLLNIKVVEAIHRPEFVICFYYLHCSLYRAISVFIFTICNAYPDFGLFVFMYL
jgi:hypothetical protein